jgi:DNA polymerase
MSDAEQDWRRQLLGHVAALRASGVLFVPKQMPLPWQSDPAEKRDDASYAAAPSSPLEAASVQSGRLFSEEAVELSAVPVTIEGRQQALAELAEEVARCRRCEELYATRTQTVFGVGPLDPEICFVGEAPGADEDRLGEPFVGRAGQLLTRIIEAMGLRREDVYICNILKCRPPGNRTPTMEECRNCFPFFERQFALVRPRYLVALGNTAARALLQTTAGVTKLRGRIYEYRGVPLICTYHPAALLRDPSGKMKRETWEDMKMLLRLMGRPIPNSRQDDNR